jgi:hypothetical protein
VCHDTTIRAVHCRVRNRAVRVYEKDNAVGSRIIAVVQDAMGQQRELPESLGRAKAGEGQLPVVAKSVGEAACSKLDMYLEMIGSTE